MISMVKPGGPAHDAGLRSGDLVLDFGGTPVGTIDALQRLLTADVIGMHVPIRVLRDGQPRGMVVVPREPRAGSNPEEFAKK